MVPLIKAYQKGGREGRQEGSDKDEEWGNLLYTKFHPNLQVEKSLIR
jgi:hypothetical protein